MLGPLRPHVCLRLLRERQGRISKAENGEHLLRLIQSNSLWENTVTIMKKGRKEVMSLLI